MIISIFFFNVNLLYCAFSNTLFVMFGFYVTFLFLAMFGCYIKEREKKNEKWGRGVNCKEGMREKNEMGEGGCMCVVGEKKKERQGNT